MRTTIRLDEDLLRQAKKQALASNRTLTAVIEDALRAALLPRAEQNEQASVALKTFRGNGLCPGVDLDDSRALLEVMES